jgi:hypothetical protein
LDNIIFVDDEIVASEAGDEGSVGSLNLNRQHDDFGRGRRPEGNLKEFSPYEE